MPWVLPVVRQAEKVLAADETLNKEYLPVLGFEKFSAAATKILLGSDSQPLRENRVSILILGVISACVYLRRRIFLDLSG